jgi:hypothetical protein
MHAQPSYMDVPHHVVSSGRWYATWFLTVEEIFPLEYGSLELWLRSILTLESIRTETTTSRGYKSPCILIEVVLLYIFS